MDEMATRVKGAFGGSQEDSSYVENVCRGELDSDGHKALSAIVDHAIKETIRTSASAEKSDHVLGFLRGMVAAVEAPQRFVSQIEALRRQRGARADAETESEGGPDYPSVPGSGGVV